MTSKSLLGRLAVKVPALCSILILLLNCPPQGRATRTGKDNSRESLLGWGLLAVHRGGEEEEVRPSSKATLLSEYLSLHQEFLQKERAPKVLVGCSQQTFL